MLQEVSSFFAADSSASHDFFVSVCRTIIICCLIICWCTVFILCHLFSLVFFLQQEVRADAENAAEHKDFFQIRR